MLLTFAFYYGISK